jgi:hypothetical protein
MDTRAAYDFYLPISDVRKPQLDVVSNLLDNHFDFGKIEAIETGASFNLEDGCFGVFICKLALDSGGTFSSVDNNEEISKKSQDLYQSIFPTGKIDHYIQDSVEYLKNYEGSPNLVHLDSWDLDIMEPVRSMLHGWLEFEAIKDKMPSGSICIVDDNFMKGTCVYWNWQNYDNGTNGTDLVDINYEIVGKGSLIYHWAQKPNTDWDLIGDHYELGSNIKVVVKKR